MSRASSGVGQTETAAPSIGPAAPIRSIVASLDTGHVVPDANSSPCRSCTQSFLITFEHVGEDDNAGAEARGADQYQVDVIDPVEQVLAASDGDGEYPEVELVNEVVLHQRAVELARAELQEVLAGLLLQLGHLGGDVPFDKGCVPLQWPFEGPRGDILGQAVDPVGELTFPRGP